MKLSVFKDNELLQELELQEGTLYTVGRKESCHIVLDKLPGISREHFEIDEDGYGFWRVNVLSEVMPLERNGEEERDFLMKGEGEFFLRPYRFVFKGEGASTNPTAPNTHTFSNIDISKSQKPTSKEDDFTASIASSDEKTTVHNFNGIPYVKIIGKNGQKSEYFRLEGNLWVIGGDESSSVYIKEPSISHNHFEISKTDKGFFVMDSGSPMGTQLNGQKLAPKKPTRLLSGDILMVGATSIQFELRDQAFKRKVNNIPINMYKNPLVFFDQDVAMVSLDDKETHSQPGKAEALSMSATQDPQEKKKLIIRIVAGLLIALTVAAQFMPKEQEKVQQINIGADPFSQLDPAEKKIVVQTFKLAKQLFLAKNYELALVQLDKLHSIIPVYKDSKEIEEFCINSRELKRHQALIEKQKREQERIENQVRSYIAQCNNRYARSSDIDGVKACLSPASELDPNNPAISQLITDVTARQEEAKIRAKIAQEQQDKIRRGRELFLRARQLHKKNSYLKAIEAYENHIHSGLPDPKRLVKKSKRHLASIEGRIKSQKTKLINEAEGLYGGTKLRDAIRMARKAQKVDPYDPKISSFLFKVERELKSRMKSIYMDSVIEERFGNMEASRVKWEEIIRTDIEDGEYYKKAKRKLKQYGYKH